MFKQLFIMAILSLGILVPTKSAFSYPQFIGHGYNACLTCHYNPHGNGPLTDYGRALGAAEVSAKWLWPDKTTDDEVGEKSGFLFSKPSQDWFRPSVNYRGLYLKNNFGEKNEESSLINMQANVGAVIKFDKQDKYIIAASMGYAPQPLGDENGTYDKYRSREHYLGIRPSKTFGMYLGLMDKVFGLRIPDHIAYSKTLTSLTMNDQSYGTVIHFNWTKVEWALHYFVGNLAQENTDLRQKGYSGKFEYLFNETTKGGISILSSKSELVEDSATAIHLKKGLGKGHSLMFEFGRVAKFAPQRNSETESDYGFAQTHIRLARGIYYLTTVEYLRGDNTKTDYSMRLIPGIQIYPSQRVELRVEAMNTRNFSETSVLKDAWTIMGQLHLWF